LGVGVCLSSISHDNQIALQVVGERTSAWLPFRTAAKLLSRLSRWSGRERLLGFPPLATSKWLSRCSGRKCLLGFPFPQSTNGSPVGLGENVCLVSLSHNRQMAFLVAWERAFPSPQLPNGSPGGLG
jgi:hypothetical protein